MYDLDSNGYITRQEMLEIVTGENIFPWHITFLNQIISAIYKMVTTLYGVEEPGETQSLIWAWQAQHSKALSNIFFKSNLPEPRSVTSFEFRCARFAKPMFDYNVTIMYSRY